MTQITEEIENYICLDLRSYNIMEQMNRILDENINVSNLQVRLKNEYFDLTKLFSQKNQLLGEKIEELQRSSDFRGLSVKEILDIILKKKDEQNVDVVLLLLELKNLSFSIFENRTLFEASKNVVQVHQRDFCELVEQFIHCVLLINGNKKQIETSEAIRNAHIEAAILKHQAEIETSDAIGNAHIEEAIPKHQAEIDSINQKSRIDLQTAEVSLLQNTKRLLEIKKNYPKLKRILKIFVELNYLLQEIS